MPNENQLADQVNPNPVPFAPSPVEGEWTVKKGVENCHLFQGLTRILTAPQSEHVLREMQDVADFRNSSFRSLSAQLSEAKDSASLLIQSHQEAWHNLAVLLGVKCWPMQEPRFVSEKVASHRAELASALEAVRLLLETSKEMATEHATTAHLMARKQAVALALKPKTTTQLQ